jgi:predicted amino acid racemase
MQADCLLEKLDWVFTNSDWAMTFPNTMAFDLSHEISDHVPYVIQTQSSVPRANIFRFENY